MIKFICKKFFLYLIFSIPAILLSDFLFPREDGCELMNLLCLLKAKGIDILVMSLFFTIIDYQGRKKMNVK